MNYRKITLNLFILRFQRKLMVRFNYSHESGRIHAMEKEVELVSLDTISFQVKYNAMIWKCAFYQLVRQHALNYVSNNLVSRWGNGCKVNDARMRGVLAQWATDNGAHAVRNQIRVTVIFVRQHVWFTQTRDSVWFKFLFWTLLALCGQNMTCSLLIG